MSVDADLMVRLWKERRLDKWTGEGVEEEVDREESGRDNVSSQPKEFNNIADHKKEVEAVKKKTNCCSNM